MFTYSYEIIKLKLQSAVVDLREVEWYTGQDNLTDKNASIKAAPAIYIEFLPALTENLNAGQIQKTIAQFDLILVTETLLDGDKRIKKDTAKDHMLLLDKCFKALQGYGAKISVLPAFAALLNTDQDQRAFNSLTRISITPPHQPRKAIMRSVQRFQGTFYDHAAAKVYTTPSPAPPLQVTTDMV